MRFCVLRTFLTVWKSSAQLMRRGLLLVIAGAFADKPCENAEKICCVGEPDGSGNPLDRCGNGRGFMSFFTAFLLFASVGCSTARAVFSKKLGACAATSGFFRTQALLYVFAAVTVGVPNVKTLWHLSAEAAALGAACVQLMHVQRLSDDVADGHSRIQGCVRILENDLNITSQFFQFLRCRICNIFSIKMNRSPRTLLKMDDRSSKS